MGKMYGILILSLRCPHSDAIPSLALSCALPVASIATRAATTSSPDSCRSRRPSHHHDEAPVRLQPTCVLRSQEARNDRRKCEQIIEFTNTIIDCRYSDIRQ